MRIDLNRALPAAQPSGNAIPLHPPARERRRATPVVEIYSEHGASEEDRGAYPMVTHSFGGRQTANTVQAALARGLRFGFVGSSDNHAGFPGAYASR